MLRSRLVGGVAAAAFILATASPAAAQYRGGWGHRHHHHDNGGGAVLGAILGVGLIAAIAASASRNRDDADRRVYDDAPPPNAPLRHPDFDDDAPPPPGDLGEDGADYRGTTTDQDYAAGRGDPSQDQAVDDCALAARDEGSRSGGYAEVRDITSVTRLGTGWDISGTIDQRTNFRANASQQHGFRCAWQDGRVSAVSLTD